MKHLLLLACCGLGSALAQQMEGFQTPSGNIHCLLIQDRSLTTLRCDLWHNTAPTPAKPADCPLDWGNAFAMEPRGRAVRMCYGDTVIDPDHPVLAYGKTWKKAGISCTSLQSGLKCTNTSGRGWTLARARQVLF